MYNVGGKLLNGMKSIYATNLVCLGLKGMSVGRLELITE